MDIVIQVETRPFAYCVALMPAIVQMLVQAGLRPGRRGRQQWLFR